MSLGEGKAAVIDALRTLQMDQDELATYMRRLTGSKYPAQHMRNMLGPTPTREVGAPIRVFLTMALALYDVAGDAWREALEIRLESCQ